MKHNGQRGSALMMVLITFMVLMVLGISVIAMSEASVSNSVAAQQHEKVYYAAESAARVALTDVRNALRGRSETEYDGASSPGNFFDGTDTGDPTADWLEDQERAVTTLLQNATFGDGVRVKSISLTSASESFEKIYWDPVEIPSRTEPGSDEGTTIVHPGYTDYIEVPRTIYRFTNVTAEVVVEDNLSERTTRGTLDPVTGEINVADKPPVVVPETETITPSSTSEASSDTEAPTSETETTSTTESETTAATETVTTTTTELETTQPTNPQLPTQPGGLSDLVVPNWNENKVVVVDDNGITVPYTGSPASFNNWQEGHDAYNQVLADVRKATADHRDDLLRGRSADGSIDYSAVKAVIDSFIGDGSNRISITASGNQISFPKDTMVDLRYAPSDSYGSATLDGNYAALKRVYAVGSNASLTLKGNFPELEYLVTGALSSLTLDGYFPKLKSITTANVVTATFSGTFESLEYFRIASGTSAHLGAATKPFHLSRVANAYAENAKFYTNVGTFSIDWRGGTSNSPATLNGAIIANEGSTVILRGNAGSATFFESDSIFGGSQYITFENFNEPQCVNVQKIPQFYTNNGGVFNVKGSPNAVMAGVFFSLNNSIDFGKYAGTLYGAMAASTGITINIGMLSRYYACLPNRAKMPSRAVSLFDNAVNSGACFSTCDPVQGWVKW